MSGSIHRSFLSIMDGHSVGILFVTITSYDYPFRNAVDGKRDPDRQFLHYWSRATGERKMESQQTLALVAGVYFDRTFINDRMKYIVLGARLVFSAILFITVAKYLMPTRIDVLHSVNITYSNYLLPASAILSLLGGVSVVVGYKAKIGAWLIVVFLIPVTLLMHPFWKETELFQTEIELAMFAKNISLIGAAMVVSYFGSGPISLDGQNKSKGKLNLRLQAYSPLQSLEWSREHLKKYV